MSDVLNGLNKSQTAAVTSPASVIQILAPPGSGKTKTLTARVAYLISHHGLDPQNIIVCTFTVKAAREMKDRIRKFLGEDLASQLVLGTFHSVARRYLARHAARIGIDRKFGIADSSDSLNIISRIIKRVRSNVKPSQARSRVSMLKSKGVQPEDIRATKSVDQQEFSQIYSEYQEALQIANLLDYDDLLIRCAELLRLHPQIVEEVEAVLIDEFQDTNNVQFELMSLFAQSRKRISIVGDPDQSIYGFRAAEIENLAKMTAQYPGTIVINLEENYRSAGAILLAASEIIEQDSSRPIKRITPTHSLGLQPVLRHLPSASIEATWIVREIKRSAALTGNLLRGSDYSILLRSASLSRLIEAELAKAGVPYRMVGGLRFFDRMEVKLVLDYMRIINDPNHNEALARILNTPPRGIGLLTMQKLILEADEKKVPLWTVITRICQGIRRPAFKLLPQAEKGLEALSNFILTARKKLPNKVSEDYTLRDFIQHVIDRLGIEKYLKATKPEDFEARLANVQELLAFAAEAASEATINEPKIGAERAADDFPRAEFASETVDSLLGSFLANVTLSTEVAKENEEEDSVKDQVTLSTIHAAKGLEWPVVFIPAAYEGSIPHSRAEDTDEERRLLYVAMTRAQSLLYISCPEKDSRSDATKLSQFLICKQAPHLFADRGPNISCDDVRELAGILRRPSPSEADIRAARAQLEQQKDEIIEELSWQVRDDTKENNSASDCDRPIKRYRAWSDRYSTDNGAIALREGGSQHRQSPLSTMPPAVFMTAASVLKIDILKEQERLEVKPPAPAIKSSTTKADAPKAMPQQRAIHTFFVKKGNVAGNPRPATLHTGRSTD